MGKSRSNQFKVGKLMKHFRYVDNEPNQFHRNLDKVDYQELRSINDQIYQVEMM